MYYFDPSEGRSGKVSKVTPLEFLYFFINNEALYSHNNYEVEYRKNLKKNYGIEVDVKTYCDRTKLSNFWFHDKKPWEYELGSKINFTQLLIDHEFYSHEVSILRKKPSQALQGIYKSEFGFSGMGIKRDFSLLKFPLVYESELERIFDFSVSRVKGVNDFIYENVVDKNFHYKGSSFDMSEYEDIILFLMKKGVDEKEASRFKKSFDFIKSKIEVDFSLDSFIYKTKSGLKVHPGCEVNLRKTMGSIFYRIWKKYLRDFDKVSFRVDKKKVEGNIISPLNQGFLVSYLV